VAASVLITGSSGLIGRYVLEQWDLPEARLVLVDRGVDDLLSAGVPSALIQAHAPTVVVHLAWSASGTAGYRSSPDNDRWVAASIELAQACRASGAWFIGTGTSLDEGGESFDAYTSSKISIRLALQSAIDSGEITWLRPYYVFDAEIGRPALVAEAIAARGRGEPIELRSPGSEHDFILAVDVARAIVSVVRHGIRGVVQIGSGELRTVEELVSALGVESTAAPDRGPSVPQLHDRADPSALFEIGWVPEATSAFFLRSRESGN